MAHNRDSLISEKAETFESLLQESKELLSTLRKEVTNGEGILDPNTQKKKELLVKLDPIMKELHTQWKALSEEEEKARLLASISSVNEDEKLTTKETSPAIAIANARKKLKSVMQHLKDIITAITALTITTESHFKEKIDHFNQENRDVDIEISALSKEYALLRKNTAYIARLEYGKDLSTYMTYGTAALKAVVTIGLAWFHTLGEAAETAGTIFYPISAAFTSSAKLFSFLGRTTQFFIASTEANKREISEVRKLELEDTKALLRKSAMFKLLTFSLSLLSTLALAGVLATPIGWAFVAAATLVDWIDDGLGASQRADKALQKFKEKHTEELVDPAEENRDILNQLKILQKKADQAKSEARWGFANTVAMILIACGPIPFAGPILGLAGLAVFGIVSIRNTYVAAKPYVEKYFTATEPKQDDPEKEALPPKKQHKHTIEIELAIIPGQARIMELLAGSDPKKPTPQTHADKPGFTSIFKPPINDLTITELKETVTLGHKTNKNSGPGPSSGSI